MKCRMLVLGAALLLVTSSVAQRRGTSGAPGGQSGTRASGSKIDGSETGAGGGSQQQLRIDANATPRQQLKNCRKSADRIRTRSHEMSRLASGKRLTPDQAHQWREQIRSEVRTINQNQEQLMAELPEGQKLATQETAQQMEQSRSQLERLAELLDNELITEELDQEQVRERASETERAATQLKQSQAEFLKQLAQNQ